MTIEDDHSNDRHMFLHVTDGKFLGMNNREVKTILTLKRDNDAFYEATPINNKDVTLDIGSDSNIILHTSVPRTAVVGVGASPPRCRKCRSRRWPRRRRNG